MRQALYGMLDPDLTITADARFGASLTGGQLLTRLATAPSAGPGASPSGVCVS